MRYPLVAFLFVFLLGPYTAHALLTGSARFQPKAVVTAVEIGPIAKAVIHSRSLDARTRLSSSISLNAPRISSASAHAGLKHTGGTLAPSPKRSELR